MNQPAGISFAVIVNLRAEEWVVNSQKMVQKEDPRANSIFMRRNEQ
jgi:hypothetical protein